MSMQGSAMMYVTVTESTHGAEPAELEKPRPEPGRAFLRRLATVAVLGLFLVGAYFVAAAFLPRWWAHRVGDQVGGSIASGIGLGLFYGFAFTFVPLVVLWLGFRRRRSLRVWAVVLGLAIVLAAPNLLTLGIVLGRGNAAHAGDRTLDVEAPSFRGSALVGAIAAVVAVVVVVWLFRARRHARERERRLREQLAEARAEQVEPKPEPG
jgi:glucan phosphoethanolaminetransferase (alkaline phosphatase superfamily)